MVILRCHILTVSEKENDLNIWEDKDVPPPDQPETGETSTGNLSLNQLVARLTPNNTVPSKTFILLYEPNPGIMDFGVFLTMYKTFTTPGKLVRKLIERYRVPE